jgi:hypothetical protein
MSNMTKDRMQLKGTILPVIVVGYVLLVLIPDNYVRQCIV